MIRTEDQKIAYKYYCKKCDNVYESKTKFLNPRCEECNGRLKRMSYTQRRVITK